MDIDNIIKSNNNSNSNSSSIKSSIINSKIAYTLV